MKIKENVTMYYCDFCKKKGMHKGLMVKHEKWCASNPENRRACEGCNHLQEVKIDIFSEHSEDGTRQVKGFRCSVLKKILYPVKVEKKGLPIKYPETFENQEPMPTHCQYHRSEFDHILSEYNEWN